jgi:hypothetical protein
LYQPARVALALIAAAFVSTAHARTTLETRKSVAGIEAVEASWVLAFVSGDSNYLDALLDADYVSVNTKGAQRSKADIIELARKIGADPKKTPVPPPSATRRITLRGNAAIVTDSQAGQISVDVFRYEHGVWHAWYSQHTAIAAPAPVN